MAKTCKECGVELYYSCTTGFCKNHKPDPKFSQGKRCAECNVPVLNTNKTGNCNAHRVRTGSSNPMAGRSVYDQWVKKYGVEEANRRRARQLERTSAASKRNWEDPAYRQLVKDATTGLKRTLEFRQSQSSRTKKQMEDPAQRALRSESIARSYETGALNGETNVGNQYGVRGYWNGIFYMSKKELSRMQALSVAVIEWKRYRVSDFNFLFKYEFAGKLHTYLPDFVITQDGCIIVEEVKANASSLTDIELAKEQCARRLAEEHNFTYRIVDNALDYL